MAAPLERAGRRFFADANIAAGATWRASIQNALDRTSVALLFVSRHFLNSKFIMERELPYFLEARNNRGLAVVWVLVSECLYDGTAIETIQAALPTNTPLEAMPTAAKNKALKDLCGQIDRAWKASENPKLNVAYEGKKVRQMMDNFQLLAYPANRRVEIFVRPDNSAHCYHQGAILAGQRSLRCYFGSVDTKPGRGFHIIAVTTEAAIPNQGGKPTNPLPKYRTIADGLRVVRE
jgi:hypothetical protein